MSFQHVELSLIGVDDDGDYDVVLLFAIAVDSGWALLQPSAAEATLVGDC